MAWGRAERLRASGEATLSSRENRVELLRGALTEWYVNMPEGIEQGFTIPEPPDGANGELVLDMRQRVSGGQRVAREHELRRASDRALLPVT